MAKSKMSDFTLKYSLALHALWEMLNCYLLDKNKKFTRYHLFERAGYGHALKEVKSATDKARLSKLAVSKPWQQQLLSLLHKYSMVRKIMVPASNEIGYDLLDDRYEQLKYLLADEDKGGILFSLFIRGDEEEVRATLRRHRDTLEGKELFNDVECEEYPEEGKEEAQEEKVEEPEDNLSVAEAVERKLIPSVKKVIADVVDSTRAGFTCTRKAIEAIDRHVHSGLHGVNNSIESLTVSIRDLTKNSSNKDRKQEERFNTLEQKLDAVIKRIDSGKSDPAFTETVQLLTERIEKDMARMISKIDEMATKQTQREKLLSIASSVDQLSNSMKHHGTTAKELMDTALALVEETSDG